MLTHGGLRNIFLLQLAFAVLLHFPALSGKVPFPAQIVNSFPPWQNVPEANVESIPFRDLGDAATQYYPWHVFAGEILHHRTLPAWNPAILGGTPFIANMQSAIFYPLTWLFAFMSGPAAWTLLLGFRTLLAGVFAAVFLRELGLEQAAAQCGGMIFAACGFMTVWRCWAMVEVAVWLPFTFFSVLLLSRQLDGFAVGITAFGFAMVVLAGHPETAAHVIMATVAFACFRCALLPNASRLRFTGLFVLAAVIGVGVAFPQLLPAFQWLGHIARTLNDRFPPLPGHYVQAFFSRDLLHRLDAGFAVPEHAAYVGICTFVLSPFAFNSKHRHIAYFFAILAAVAGGVVYGIAPFSYLATTLPVLSGLNNIRMILILDFAFAVLASIGFSNLLELRRLRYGPLLLAVTTGVCGWGIWRVHKIQAPMLPFLDSAVFTTILLAISALVVLLRLRSYLSSSIFAGLILSLVAIDAGSFSFGYVPFVPARSLFPESPVISFLKTNLGPGERVGIIDDAMPVNVGMVYGISSIDGYEFRLRSSRDLFSDFDERGPLPFSQALHSARVKELADRRVDMMSVKYFVTSNTNAGSQTLASDPARFQLVHSFGSVDIFENRRVLRPVQLIPAAKIEVLSHPEEQLRRVKEAEFDPASSAILSELPKFGTSSLPIPPSSRVQDVRFEPAGEVSVRAEAVVPSVLVVNQIFYPGWRVRIDGQPKPVLTPDFALMGVALDAGVHNVQFEFSSTPVHVGIAVSITSVMVCAILLRKTWGEGLRIWRDL